MWEWWWISWNSISDSFRKRFHLIDIIAKKIKVVQAVVDGLGLEDRAIKSRIS
jgi:hypothetical protein